MIPSTRSTLVAWVLFVIGFGCANDRATPTTSSTGASPAAASSSATASAAPSAAPAPSAAAAGLYRDDEGRFEIAMPAPPKIEQAPGIMGASTQHMASAKTSDAIYYAMWFDFPADQPFNPAGAIDGARDNLLKQDKLELTSERNFSFPGGFPARDVTASSKTAEPWKDMMRAVIAGRRNYLVFVRGVSDEKKAQAYLDSFRVLEN